MCQRHYQRQLNPDPGFYLGEADGDARSVLPPQIAGAGE
jgi:hypothetical protein